MKHYHLFFPFLFGVLFSFGLGTSGMMSPHKVQGFLDLFGQWDSDLLWVLIGAITTTILTFPWILRKNIPLFTEKFFLPTKPHIDLRLLSGSALFGIGWALSGLCPGPALANITSLNSGVLLFSGSMLLAFAFLEH